MGGFFGLQPDEWSAIAALGTFFVALFATVFAFMQIRQARALRIEQTRPYVAAYLELGHNFDISFIFLVVKNFGSTTARDITVTSDISMKRAWGNVSNPETLLLFDKLPVLVPGQEWRTLFDWGPSRVQAELDEKYTLTVMSSNSSGKPLPGETFVLDWNTFKPTKNIGVKTIHDVGKSMKKIEETLGKWTEGHRGLSVVSRDGHRKDAEVSAANRERRQPVEEQEAVRKEVAIEQVVDTTSHTANYRVSGEEEDVPSYPSVDEGEGGEQTEQ
jgi:hypothetical protein